MIYHKTDSHSVIIKLFRDIKNFNGRLVQPALEWIGEVIELVGYYGQTITKNVELTSSNYRVEMPCDLIKLNGLYADSIRMGYDSTQSLLEIDQFSDLVSNNYYKYGFKIEPSWIKTDEESITFIANYEALEVDDDGLPMVPDTIQFRDACLYYIIMKMLELGIEHPVLKYPQAEVKWLNAKRAAKSKHNMPDRSRMLSFISGWKRYIPTLKEEIYPLDYQDY